MTLLYATTSFDRRSHLNNKITQKILQYNYEKIHNNKKQSVADGYRHQYTCIKRLQGTYELLSSIHL